MSTVGSHASGSSLSVEAIEEQDFAHRKQRHRKSAGFLLDSTFAGGPRSRHSHDGTHAVDAKGKRSSPLSREVRMADQNMVESRHRVDSPNMHGDPEPPAPTAPHATTIDPNQIVHMALNLSESRKRNFSPGQLLVPQPRVSSGVGLDGSFHSQGTGSTLRQYLNEQRASSQNPSPNGRGSSARRMSTPVQRSGTLYIQGRPFEPSDATLARREKARAFFELRMEYLRLLDYLPPLKPDSSEPGNFIVSANAVPGSPHAQLTRVPSHAGKRYELGRQYNPLQSLRNRRTRARERKTLEHPPEEFADVDQVRDWVDRVEAESRHSHYRQTEQVALPRFHEDHDGQIVPTQPTRPHMVWVFASEELLADAHWMELGDHKTLIEDRHGSKIFPPTEPQKQDFLQARPSKDYADKRSKSWIEGLPSIPADPLTGDESEATSDRGRKRRLLPTFRPESPKRKKHGKIIHRTHGGRHSDSSDSDSDTGRTRQRKPHKILDSNKDTAPLELRMKELIEKEAQEAQLKTKSPAIFTPDTPDKWGRQNPEGRESVRNSLEVPGSSNRPVRPNVDLGLKLPPMHRADMNHGTDRTKEYRSSFDGSTAPSTPLHQMHFPHTSSELSSPHSQPSSLKKKAKKSKLDIFRSDETSKHHKHDNHLTPDSAGSDKKHSSRQASEETEDGTGIGAAIWAAPGAVKSLLGHRKNDSVGSLQSPVKEPHSAVTRFFKGVKHEGSKVQEFIFRKDRPLDDSDAEAVSDQNTAQDTDTDNEAGRPNFARSATSETMDSTTSKISGRYHLELPSFRSPHQQKIDENAGYLTDPYLADHVTRQARERANSRSSRFDLLAPPPMDLSRISSKESTYPDRVSKALARPGVIGLGGLPVTGLAQKDAKCTSSRPTIEGRRHWSITNENGNAIHRKLAPTVVTAADIARVRALFLCSGVKAKQLGNKATEVRGEPPEFLKRAAETANAQLYPVKKKEEHVLAAQILDTNIKTSTAALEGSATAFRDSTVHELMSLISNLKSQIETDLFPRLINSGDEAVTITSEVSSSAPLTVKQIRDEIDRMLRVRRRRMRWVRGLGWTMVEWMLLGFMWFAWLTPKGSASFAAILSAFVPTWTTALLFMGVFVLIRHRYPKIYSPRTFIGTIPEKDRTPSASRSYFDWVHTLRVIPDKFVLYHVSLDAYLYLRFLRTLIFLCVVGAGITWPILMPINATGGGTSSQLDRISIGNVAKKKHLYAHAVVAWVYFGFVMFTVARERLWLIGLRQAWNLSKPNATRLSSRVVLFLSAPTAALDQENLDRFFGPDAVRVWPATKADKLQSLVSSRDSLVEDLERAEMQFIHNVNKKAISGKKKRDGSFRTFDDLSDGMKKSLRPTHRLKTASGPVGKKVDSITWYREQIKVKESGIERARDSNENAESHGGAAAVFVEFKTQAAAQRGYQQIASAEILALNPRFTGVLPGEVIWNNLVLPPARRISQAGMATALVIAIIIFWSIPVSFVGAFSNVSYLAENFKWLAWLNRLPETVIGILSGLVPPLLLSLLATWVPNIFRTIFKAFGEPTNTSAELKVLKWYYVFQVLQIFLVNTIASGAAAVLSQIVNNPSEVPRLLADKLPSAANSYLTYFIVQGLTSASTNILNYSDLLSYIFYDYFFDKTPRQKYNSYTNLKGMAWGKLFPKFGNFLIIAIAYSCVAPLVLGFAAVGLSIFYVSYRYLLLFTAQPKIDTKGQCYTLALQQIITGVYIAELCLIGLFGLRQATGPSIMTAVLFIATIIFNATSNRYFAPLEQYLPADLAQESGDTDNEESAPLLSSAEEGEAGSRIERHLQRLPVSDKYLSPVARFFNPQVHASHRALKTWLRSDAEFDEDSVPEYSEQIKRKAYLNPAYTSKTPVVWLPKDEVGVSKREVSENEKEGLEASDEAARLEGKKVKWEVENFGKVPIFKAGMKW
ncbi:DUF221-domain-containing protein [Massarina eburnea CBS 473.64]|uniref:DUF221-domain-containing protein n=1 Tax=Massarina eburnea CBS 473.64 TaxID=1395130 RepID=A0A6A6SAP5_9PLEO|nr:DUF221-domain-containing protein [Massarina eburnea CBS 473.64]